MLPGQTSISISYAYATNIHLAYVQLLNYLILMFTLDLFKCVKCWLRFASAWLEEFQLFIHVTL